MEGVETWGCACACVCLWGGGGGVDEVVKAG